MRKLLIVDDDSYLRAMIRTFAEVNGFLCREAEDGSTALLMAEQTVFDLIVLDVMMPGKDGFETLSELRGSNNNTPVLLLTARKEEYDKLLGYNLGADDFMPKPFSPNELMARIKAILKRIDPVSEKRVQFGELVIIELSRVALLHGAELELTPKEFDLLLHFSKNNHLVLNREQLLKFVWGYDYSGDARTVDTHVKSLRRKLCDHSTLIRTVWGTGYRFEY